MAYKGGLKKWFNEDWRDIKTGEECGRSSSKDSSRPYPACRPKAVASRMTKAEKKSAARQKTGPEKYSGYALTASGKRRLKIRKNR